MSALAKIHIGKKSLGLDDDTYRLMLVRVTGKASSAEMTEGEREAVVAEMQRQGFKPKAKPSSAPGARNLDGTYGKVGRALWLTGWNLGVFRDRTDDGLLAFVKRQTKIDHLNWVRDAEDGKAVMEALKSWISRATGIRWPTEHQARKAGKSVARARKEAVYLTQHRILDVPASLLPAMVDDAELDQRIAAMGKRIRAAQGKTVA